MCFRTEKKKLTVNCWTKQEIHQCRNRLINGLLNVSPLQSGNVYHCKVAHMTHSDQKTHRYSFYSVYVGLALAISRHDFLIDKSRQETTHWCVIFICATVVVWFRRENFSLCPPFTFALAFLSHSRLPPEWNLANSFFAFRTFRTTSASIVGCMSCFFSPSKTPTHDQSLESGDVRRSHCPTTLVFAAIFEMETLMGPITYLPSRLPTVLDDTRRLALSRMGQNSYCPYCMAEIGGISCTMLCTTVQKIQAPNNICLFAWIIEITL